MRIILFSAVASLLFALSSVPGMRLASMGSARLLSIEELPEAGDMCERSHSVSKRESLPEQNLFIAFEETPVHAQDNSGTVDVTRPPVRDNRDTAPIYSSRSEE